ncbi:MAG: LuxR family transcriptional regulator [Gammaproteobacteria bacterium]|nr:LuxR family transcriptional regulator [Gammaproteobacteria bacterium]MBK7519901.1 LuxR family transcriptional regulator [Gammaproteobacteria bacterium]
MRDTAKAPFTEIMVREGRLDNAALGQALADVIGHLGNARLVDRLASLLHVLVPANDIMVVVYRRGQPPELLYDQSAGLEGAANLELYLKGAYLLDPFYRAFADGVAPGCYRLKQLAPAAFRSSEYFRLHYARTGISDEIGYLLEPTADMCVHLSVGVREQQSRISAAQHRRLLDFEPLFAAIVRRHWAPHDAIVSRAINTQLDSALKFFGHDFLTDREVEVIQLLLRGHSTKSIAERLRISPETVKLHRKHSYAKLDVSSQAELFHLFIDALGSYQGGDPLTGYLSH